MVDEPKIETILFAADFLENSRLALDYAVALAHDFKSSMVMLHVVELSSPAVEAELLSNRPCVTRKDAQERLEAFASGVRRTGIDLETYVDDGIPCEKILKAISDFHADILVLGIHGVHRGLTHLLIGSNTEKILISAACPVMTVGAHVLTGIDFSLHPKEILYVSDLTPAAAAAAPYALLFGKAFQVPVDLCDVIPEIAERDTDLQRKLAQEYCEMMCCVIAEPTYSKWCLPSFHLEHGMGSAQIIQRASTQLAGLVVLGVHTESLLARHLHTSLAYQLLAKATCPVLTVRRD